MARIALLACFLTTLSAVEFRVAPVPERQIEKMRATTWRLGCPVAPEDLRQVTVTYLNFDRKVVTGVLFVHKDVAKEISEIFRDLFKHRFQIEKITPVEDYGGSDDA